MSTPVAPANSELIGLLWEMIDWERSEIKLTSQLKWLRERSAGRASQSRVVSDEIFRSIATIWPSCGRTVPGRWKKNSDAARSGKKTDWCFRPALPFHPRNLIDDLERDAKKAGIGKVTVHELRHTSGSLMLQAGKTMTTVSKILGHSSVGVTEKIYAHAYEDDKRDAVSSVSQRLRRVEGDE